MPPQKRETERPVSDRPIVMKPLGIISGALTFLLASALGRAACGKAVKPISWRQVSEDGQFVLVMVSPLPVDEDAGPPVLDGTEIRGIRATYSQSGMYRNDGSQTPLWTIHYFAWTYHVHIAPDGRHLIVAGPWSGDSHVVTFLSDGREIASYDIKDLLSLTRLRQSEEITLTDCSRHTPCAVRDFGHTACAVYVGIGKVISSLCLRSLVTRQYPEYAWSRFDPEETTCTVRTNHGDQFVFDVTTGKILRQCSSWHVALALVFVAATLGLVALLVLRSRFRRRVE